MNNEKKTYSSLLYELLCLLLAVQLCFTVCVLGVLYCALCTLYGEPYVQYFMRLLLLLSFLVAFHLLLLLLAAAAFFRIIDDRIEFNCVNTIYIYLVTLLCGCWLQCTIYKKLSYTILYFMLRAIIFFSSYVFWYVSRMLFSDAFFSSFQQQQQLRYQHFAYLTITWNQEIKKPYKIDEIDKVMQIFRLSLSLSLHSDTDLIFERIQHTLSHHFTASVSFLIPDSNELQMCSEVCMF